MLTRQKKVVLASSFSRRFVHLETYSVRLFESYYLTS